MYQSTIPKPRTLTKLLETELLFVLATEILWYNPVVPQRHLSKEIHLKKRKQDEEVKKDDNIIWNLQTTHAVNEKHCWIFSVLRANSACLSCVSSVCNWKNTFTESRLFSGMYGILAYPNRDALEILGSISTKLDCVIFKSLPIPSVCSKVNFKGASRWGGCAGSSTVL